MYFISKQGCGRVKFYALDMFIMLYVLLHSFGDYVPFFFLHENILILVPCIIFILHVLFNQCIIQLKYLNQLYTVILP